MPGLGRAFQRGGGGLMAFQGLRAPHAGAQRPCREGSVRGRVEKGPEGAFEGIGIL